jgi:hypothetical protein
LHPSGLFCRRQHMCWCSGCRKCSGRGISATRQPLRAAPAASGCIYSRHRLSALQYATGSRLTSLGAPTIRGKPLPLYAAPMLTTSFKQYTAPLMRLFTNERLGFTVGNAFWKVHPNAPALGAARFQKPHPSAAGAGKHWRYSPSISKAVRSFPCRLCPPRCNEKKT